MKGALVAVVMEIVVLVASPVVMSGRVCIRFAVVINYGSTAMSVGVNCGCSGMTAYGMMVPSRRIVA